MNFYDGKGNLISISGDDVDLTGYATEEFVRDGYQPKGEYLTEVPDEYAKDEDIPTKPEDIGALPNTYTPPNQTAEQVGADPKGAAVSAVSQHNTADDSHDDIRLELKAINDRLTSFFDSDNQTLDELSEIVAYITSNKTLIDSITTSKVNVTDIINNLTTNVSNKPLSATQGVVLKGLIDAVSNSLANYQPKGNYLTSFTETDPTVPSWAKASSKPSYSKSEVGLGNVDNVKQYSASNPPPYPVTSVNGMTGDVTLGNGSAVIADGSITPEKTNFIVCEGSGENVTTRVPNFTNLANPKSSDWKTDTRFSSSSGSMSGMAGAIVTNAIPAKVNDIIRIKGIEGGTGSTANALFQLVAYSDVTGETKLNKGVFFEKNTSSIDTGIVDVVTVVDGVTEYELFMYIDKNDDTEKQNGFMASGVSVRIGGVPVTTVDDIIITINEPITYTEVTSGGKTYTLDENINVPRASGLKSGARWFALGDSITQGWVSAADSTATSGYKQYLNTVESERWVNIVAEKNGYELTNYGVGGTGYAHHTSSTVNARTQVANIDFSKCDIVTLAFGVNDWKGKATLGSMDDDIDTVDAFVPNMRYVIKKIMSDNPWCKIFVITPLNCRSLGTYDTNWGIGYANADNASGPGLEQIFQLEKTVCEYHGIEMIDMTHNSIINRDNIRTMLLDYVHPTVECHKMIARELARKISFI